MFEGYHTLRVNKCRPQVAETRTCMVLSRVETSSGGSSPDPTILKEIVGLGFKKDKKSIESFKDHVITVSKNKRP